MFVLHAVWLPAPERALRGRLALWAEDSALPLAPPKRPGRRPKLQDHPFAAGHPQLLDLLGEADTGATVLHLPTVAGAPLASPELIRDSEPAGGGKPVLGTWRVPTAAFDADQAQQLLPALPAMDAVAAPSLVHLAAVAEFAADLVSRGRVLPGILPDGPWAVWRPLLTGPDLAWARTLALAMPVPVAASAPGDAGRTWADCLDALTDAAAHAALGASRLAIRGSSKAVVNAWLAGLTGQRRTIQAPTADLGEIEAAILDWQADAAVGPVRGCFQLEEPEEGGDTWSVRFALQASDEQSLVVPAAKIWAARGTSALAQYVDDPQERLLAELGKASRLYPALDDALRIAKPKALQLNTTGAHEFLATVAPALSIAGFGVQLPGWWSKPSARLGLQLRAKTPSQPGQVGSASSVGFDAVADFEYRLALGGRRLTKKELAELAATKAPMVRLRGQWIELDARRLASGLKLVGTNGQASIGELLRLGLGSGEREDELPIDSVDADGWLGDLLSGRADERVRQVPPDESFTGTLRPYQERGLAWLDFLHRAGIGGVLADDMGLGKTVQLLALLSRDDSEQPSLLICPMSLVGNWQREAARFTPGLRVHVHHGRERARGKAFTDAVADADLVITTYALAARDAAALRKIGWRRIVVDEAQAIKNAATKQATAIRSLPASTRVAVTGTPVENRLADLWSILEFANPGMLGPAATFKKRYAEPIERHGDDEAAQRLRRFTAPFILRRVKTDKAIISDLPEKLEMELLCNLTAEQAALYQAVVDDMLARIEASEGIERRGLVLATMTKLKQVCNHPAHFLRDGSALPARSGKLDRLDEILDEVTQVGEKALLFTQYTEFGSMLRGHLAGRYGREVLFLHGGVRKEARDEMVTRFQDESAGSPALFVLSLKAGGTGLNLTAANHVVHVDRWWNPAVEDQATDRAFRIGQRKAVQVRKFVCAGTIEEKIAAMIAQKRGLAARIVGTGESWLTELSTGELRELLRLEEGAVVE